MRAIFSQIRRLFVDDGRSDRDFSDQERMLQDALKHLREATDGCARAAGILTDLIKMRS